MDLFSQVGSYSDGEPIITEYDLPDAEITLFENFFSFEESNQLFDNLHANIKWQHDQITVYGKTYDQPRLTAWYGDEGKTYTYSDIQMNPHPWNDELILIKLRVEEVSKTRFTSCLLNYYRTGQDSVGWHQDNEKELGLNPVIASVSFGETRPFQLKHLYQKELNKVDIPLSHGSLLLMKGSTQHFWKHQIPKTKRQIGQRINLTFRVIM